MSRIYYTLSLFSNIHSLISLLLYVILLANFLFSLPMQRFVFMTNSTFPLHIFILLSYSSFFFNILLTFQQFFFGWHQIFFQTTVPHNLTHCLVHDPTLSLFTNNLTTPGLKKCASYIANIFLVFLSSDWSSSFVLSIIPAPYLWLELCFPSRHLPAQS